MLCIVPSLMLSSSLLSSTIAINTIVTISSITKRLTLVDEDQSCNSLLVDREEYSLMTSYNVQVSNNSILQDLTWIETSPWRNSILHIDRTCIRICSCNIAHKWRHVKVLCTTVLRIPKPSTDTVPIWKMKKRDDSYFC